MPKRGNPFLDDVPLQSKLYVTAKTVNKCSEERMSTVYARTMELLFSASGKADDRASGPALNGVQNASDKTSEQFRKGKDCPSCSGRSAVAACAFCERAVCKECVRLCCSCGNGFCPLCSLLRYGQQHVQAVCLSCNVPA
ncbi:apoptosis regulatory protein Siva-like [Ornithodoros turicata]|uniref:apoptosis regulatory protein Siva-like n=1 Tax=Ornithodoros turicata TaxID=34597 RepID=UPI003139FE0B